MDCLADTRCTEIAKDDYMNLTFLGTAAAEGYPDPICAYRNCVVSGPEDLDCGTFEAIPFAIEDRRGAQLFHGTDTGVSPLDIWSRLASKGETSTCSFSIKLIHSTAPVTGSHIRMDRRFGWKSRTREAGMISGKTPINARHLAHHPRKPAGIHA